MIGPWVWLLVAGTFEVVWVIWLKRSDGFTRVLPSILTVVTMAASFFCMARALRVLPMGTVYAVWTGVGAAGGLIWGIALEGEPAGLLRILCIALILAGVAGLRMVQ